CRGLGGGGAAGFPGFAGIGPSTAARLLSRYGPIAEFPPGVLKADRELATLFVTLATLRTDAPVFEDVDELRWQGPTEAFPEWAERVGDPKLVERAAKVAGRVSCFLFALLAAGASAGFYHGGNKGTVPRPSLRTAARAAIPATPTVDPLPALPIPADACPP